MVSGDPIPMRLNVMKRMQPFLPSGVLSVLVLFFGVGCTQHRTVLVTGFWPPTNDMLCVFSTDPTLNPSGWQGENWQGCGYDVYAFFPVFPKGTDKEPWGEGDFEVDYQAVRADFARLTRELKPAIILCYGRGDGPWEIETRAVFRNYWNNDYWPPQQPDWPERFDYPRGSVLALTLPAGDIERAVRSEVPGLNVWVDHDGDPGGFICGYLAFLAAEYQTQHSDRCKAAGFIHVGGQVDLQTAKKAQEATLKAVISAVDSR